MIALQARLGFALVVFAALALGAQARPSLDAAADWLWVARGELRDAWRRWLGWRACREVRP